MARYIEAERLLLVLEKNFGHTGGADTLKQLIDMQPTDDVAPVKHGEWIESDIPCEKYVCSACGGGCWYYDYQGEVAKSRYCPNCGAKMDGGGGT